MSTVGAYEAKTHLARLIEEVEAGGSVTITRHGRPVARLVGVRGAGPREPDLTERFAEARRGRTLGIPLREAIAEGRR